MPKLPVGVPNDGGPAQPSPSASPCSAVDLGGVVVQQHLPEFLVVQNALEDGFVVIHPTDNGSHEHPVEHQSEVLDGVVLGLGCHLGIGQPGFLKLIEEQLVTLVKIYPETLVQLVDDLRERFDVRLLLAATAFPEDALDLPGVGVERQRTLKGDLAAEVAQLNLGAEV